MDGTFAECLTVGFLAWMLLSVMVFGPVLLFGGVMMLFGL